MKLTNTQYDRLKQFLLMIVPAGIALIQALGSLWGFETNLITGTISIVAVFAGVLLQYISGKYNDMEGNKNE